jgi:transposase-like protein
MRDYDSVIDHLGEGFGLSKSSVSRSFIDRTAEKLEEFENRDLSNHDFISVFIDGKYLAKEQIMIVLGVTMQGDKIPIGFLQTHSENSVPIKALFENLISRGFKYDQGLLFVIDGAKGIKKAIEDIFKNKAVIQRCTWHKRENVKKYLKEENQKWFESEYHSALDRAKYSDAKKDLIRLSKELEKINISAARSLNEALDEILTLHKLKMNDKIWRSFNTTNPIENLNSQLEKYLRKVKYWKNSKMRYRWIAAGLLEIEQKMNKIFNYKKLPLLRKAIISYISNPSDLLS